MMPESNSYTRTSWPARLRRTWRGYGMLGVLILLCLFFSVVTLTEQQLTGHEAADSLAEVIAARSESGAGVLILGRDILEDSVFVDQLRTLLSRRGIGVADARTGDPAELREILLGAAATATPVGVIASPVALQPVIRGVIAESGALTGATLLSPPARQWPTFLLADNLRNVANQISVIAIIAIGMTMVIIAGGIDLSVGSLIALSAVVAAWLIAAMGGTPTAVIISITCPRSTDVEWLDALYDGVAEASRRFETPVLGGDTSVSPTIVVSVAVLGECANPILRSGAHVGDLVCVTGTLGGASGGLRILGIERVLKKPEADYGHAGLRLLDRHLKPEPRLAAGKALAAHGATAMIDVSDGLLADLGHICERSDVAMTLEAGLVPIDPDLVEVAERVVPDPFVTAMTGGEDFELAVTLPPDSLEAATAALADAGTVLTRIGIVEQARSEGAPVRVMREGRELFFARTGWVHYLDDEV